MTEITYGQLFDKSWDTIKKNLALSAGLTLVYFIGALALNMIPIIGSFIAGLLSPGYLYCLIQIRDKQSVEFQDFFWSFQDFNRVLHWMVLNAIKIIAIVIGFILLIIPGIYIGIALSLSTQYFVFRKQDGIEALKSSVRLINQHWWFMFGLAIFTVFLNLLGFFCFIIGILITIPTSVLIFYYAMEELEKVAPKELPSNTVS